MYTLSIELKGDNQTGYKISGRIIWNSGIIFNTGIKTFEFWEDVLDFISRLQSTVIDYNTEQV